MNAQTKKTLGTETRVISDEGCCELQNGRRSDLMTEVQGPSRTKLAFFIGFLILAAQVGIGYAVFRVFPDWPTRGQFGDVFGSVNALFSGLAFAGFIYTVFLQREELALQRNELELTRQELHRTAKAQEQSEVALRAQADATARSARLATTSALLEHYRVELIKMSKVSTPSGDPRRAVIDDLQQREAALLAIFNSMYQQITTEGNNDEGV